MTDLQLFAQIEAWRGKGYQPELISGSEGWMVRLDTERYRPPMQEDRTSLRFCTSFYPTPQAAIEAALKVVQP
jgi:hypothetical protein